VERRARGLLNAEVVCALALFAVVAGVFYFSRDYPAYPGQFSGSPAFWPRLIALVLALTAVFIFVAGLFKPRTTAWADRASHMKLVVVVALFYGSRWSLEWLGFVPSASLLMFLCMLVLADKKNLTVKAALGMAGASLGVSYFLYFVLAHLARIPLPRGGLF